MPAYKDKAKGTWYASFYFENWTGKKEKKMKRGFKTKREALEWERTFLQQQTADLDMTFESFVALYATDMKGRIKENTWGTKEHILYKKLVPYFGKRKMSEISSKEVMAWQSEMLNYRDKNGKPYSPVYLKTLHNQLSAVFNHAVKHYKLKANPAAQVGNMGKAKGREMLFWTKAEYLKFADAMMDKPLSYYTFEMLYWCGIREGELLALTPADFDFEAGTVKISKSYQRLHGKDVITTPKTKKSNRNDLLFSICAKQVGSGLEEQLKRFVQEHPDTKLIIIDTLQKIREAGGDKYSYANDYEVVGKLKRLADACGVCLLLVHHTRKQQADDKFDMISGTNGLSGAADGAFLLQKEKRTDDTAILDVVGRDQQDQRLYLTKDKEHLTWTLERMETELWVEPPDPVLEAVAAFITAERPSWSGTATELAAVLQVDMKPNALAMRLNVRAGKLATEYHIRYENTRTHAGRSISLTLEPPQA